MTTSPEQGERDRPDPGGALRYFQELYPDGIPAGSGVVLCKAVRDGTWFGETAQAEVAVASGEYQFIRSTACTEPEDGRGGSDLATAIPGFHADIDVLGGLHSATNLPTRDEALAFLDQLPLKPSIVLWTGGGLLVIWLFKEPWVFDGVEERARAERLHRGWQWFIQAEAGERGWHVDGTANHAQLIRIEGTLSLKYDPPRRVRRLSDTGLRWNPSDFEEWQVHCGATGPGQAGPRTINEEAEALPHELAPRVHEVLRRTGVRHRVKRTATGGVIAVLLDLCPACGGREKRGSIVTESAHLGPLSGALRCKRETCEARGSSGGLPLWTWVSRYYPEHLPHIAASAALFPPDVRRVAFDDATVELEKLIQSAIEWVRLTRGIAVIVVPMGIGKSTAVIESMRRDPHIAYLARNYLELEEKMRQAGVQVQIREGITRACKVEGVKAAERAGVMRAWRGTACSQCYLRKDCAVWASVEPNVPLFAPHQADQAMSLEEGAGSAGLHDYEDADAIFEAVEGRLVVYDECPPVLSTRVLAAAELGRVERAELRSPVEGEDPASIQQARSVAIRLSRLLQDAIRAAELRAEELREGNVPGVRYLAFEQGEIVGLLRQFYASQAEEGRRLQELSARELRLGASLDEKLFAVPGPEDRREGHWFDPDAEPTYAHDDTVPVLRAFAALLLLNGTDLLAEVERRVGRLRLAIGKGNHAFVELRLPRHLAAPNGAVILDATGFLELEAIEAANPHRPVRIFGLDVLPAEGAEIHRLWIATQSTSRRSVLRDKQLGREGSRFMKRTLERIARRAQAIFGQKVDAGIITYRAIRDGLVAAIEGKGPASDVLAGCDSFLAVDAEHLGYYGRDERGSNAFEDVSVLITWGDPRPNAGAAEAEGRALGLADPGLRGEAQTQAALAQALGRARALRGGKKLLVHVGAVCPPGWEGPFEIERMEVGRPAKAEREGYIEVCRALLETQGWTSSWTADVEFGLGDTLEGVGGNSSKESIKRHFLRPPVEGSSEAIEDFATDRTRREWVKEAGRKFGAEAVKVPLPCHTVLARPDADVRRVRCAAIKAWWRLHPDQDSPGARFGQRLWGMLGGGSTNEPAENLQGLLVDWIEWAEERAAAYQVDESASRANAVKRAGDEAEERMRRQVVIALLLLAQGGLACVDPEQATEGTNHE